MRRRTLAWVLGAIAAVAPVTARAADNQIRPFIGSTFSGSTTFVDNENGAGTSHFVVGVSWMRLGDMFGVEAEVADAPGFFEAGEKPLVLSSRVTTFTANFVVSAPRRYTEYIVRPYFVAGGGMMRVKKDDPLNVFPVDRLLPAFDLGAGAVMFLTNRVGFSGEIRRFQNLYRQTPEVGLTLGDSERLAFWRGTLAFVYRY
jgi:hypothetical protein